MSDSEVDLSEVSDHELEAEIDGDDEPIQLKVSEKNSDDESSSEEEEEEDEDEDENGDVNSEMKSALKLSGIQVIQDDEEAKLLSIIGGSNDDSDTMFGGVDDYPEDDAFDKINADLKQDYLTTSHPETQIHNYEEIKALAQVKRDENNHIVDDLHKTLPFLTKFEMTRIIAQRAQQINNGHPPFVKLDRPVMDGRLIAMKELEEKRVPFIIRRTLPSGGSEYWNVRDLELI